jgi:tetratricopeptide (TPR) repeat protein
LKNKIVIAACVMLLVVAASIMFRRLSSTTKEVAESQPRLHGPILIPGVDEPEELRVEPIPFPSLSPQMRMLSQAMESKNHGDWLQALNHVIQKYPRYGDAYAIRATLLCEGSGNGVAVMNDIESANRYGTEMLSDKPDMFVPIKAKIAHSNGNNTAAIAELFQYISKHPSDALSFAGSGGLAPEKAPSTCTWSETDIQDLIKQFPNDFKPYLFAGLYYGFFAKFTEGESSFPLASKNFTKAAELDPTSPLPAYYAAEVLRQATFLKPSMAKEADQKEIAQGIVTKLNDALRVDSEFRPALKDRAEILAELKQYRDALRDYDKVLKSDPNDSAAHNDRGLAKMETGDISGAIADFSNAIKYKDSVPSDSHYYDWMHYENRGDAYLKIGDWNAAAADYTEAISMELSQSAILMNINQFRAMYPEYKPASDEAIARKLHQTFLGNLKYEDFSERFSKENIQKPWNGFTQLSELYAKRSDAFLAGGLFHKAAIEYGRIVGAYPEGSKFERWRQIGPRKGRSLYVDLQSFGDSDSVFVSFPLKEMLGAERESGPYNVVHYKFNCSTHHVQRKSVERYDSFDSLVNTSKPNDSWQTVTPGSFDEHLANSACSI